MKTHCDTCKQNYEEEDEELFIFIENECPMICPACRAKQCGEFVARMNEPRIG